MRRNESCHYKRPFNFDCRTNGQSYQKQDTGTSRPFRRLRGCYEPIADYLKVHDRWKIMATYDAIPRIADVAGAEIYSKAFLLVDEYHRLLFDYSFRHSAIAGLLEQAPRFANKTYLSATPIEQEFLLDELQTMPQTKII